MRPYRFFIASAPETFPAYYSLRAEQYHRTFGFDGSWLLKEDAFDHSGVILVGEETATGRLVAGARMNVSTPAEPLTLPMEKIDGFSLRAALPGMRLDQRNYAEVSRLAVVPEYQNGELLFDMLNELHEIARWQSVPLVFSVCQKSQTRLYRIAARVGRMSQPFHILDGVQVPPQHGVAMRLCLFAEKGEYR